MISLLALPVLFGVLLAFDVFGNDDDDDGEEMVVPEPQIVSDGFIGTDAAELLALDEDGGFVNGAGGADSITGSDLNDGIVGGAGNDVIFARGGDDVVSGDAGDDRVFLGAGEDDYTPDDTSENQLGDDFVRGGDDSDFIVDLRGSNQLFGDLGRDVLVSFDGLSESGTYVLPEELGTTDTLSGGFGQDVLAGDDGDVMTGGAGGDLFAVIDDEDPDMPEDRAGEDLRPVRITDFNTAEDSLFVLNINGAQPTDVTLTFDPVAGGVRASYEGREVAFLEGLTAADLGDIDVTVSTLSGLDDAINTGSAAV